ncbi:MAG: polar amino acid transport system substrate-binding protein [Sulfurimonas sp.]|jgi:polar amino acid transport system substrate-binding protein|uniref:substrate-binding periplasmic protein n=1 Tax=Sulfurimonas sp. TaxID=2022749 RepID=UPI0039E3FF2A
MKKNLFLLLFLFFLPIHVAALSLKISSGFDAPETYLIESVLREGFKRANIDLVFQTLPNQRSLLNANKGISDGEASRIWKINEYYPNLIRVPVSTHSIDLVVLSKEKIDVKDFSQLKKYNVGVVRGMKIAEKLVQESKPRSYIAATNNLTLIKMLENNRIDVIVSSKIGLLVSLKESKSKDLYMIERPLLSLPLYMHLHKKHQELIPRFEKAFKSMIEDGTYQRARNSFIGSFND